MSGAWYAHTGQHLCGPIGTGNVARSNWKRNVMNILNNMQNIIILTFHRKCNCGNIWKRDLCQCALPAMAMFTTPWTRFIDTQSQMIPQCAVCLRGKHIRSQWFHISLELRGRPFRQVCALSSLTLHQSDVQKQKSGCTQFTRFTWFPWKRQGIESRTTQLTGWEQYQVRVASDSLMASRDSSFADFEQEREPNAKSMWLSYAFIMRPTLECAISPDLYPYRGWCNSIVLERGRWFPAEKRSFCANTWSALIDCKVNNRLHQHHFDRWQWATGAAAQWISNKRWASHFHTFRDVVQSRVHVQCERCGRRYCQATGTTDLVLDFCPVEWTFPLHPYVSWYFWFNRMHFDAFSVGGVVAAHIAHSITEVIKCFFVRQYF